MSPLPHCRVAEGMFVAQFASCSLIASHFICTGRHSLFIYKARAMLFLPYSMIHLPKFSTSVYGLLLW